MSGMRGREGSQNFMHQMRSELLKCNSQMIKVQKMHTHDLYL